MLTTYIQHALRRAAIEQLDDGNFVGEAPGLPGVLASAVSQEACRDELAEVIEGWVLFRVANGLEIPAIDGITVNAASVG